MKAKSLKKFISVLLCAVLIVSAVPAAVFAESLSEQSVNGFVSETHQVFSSKSSTIAPGITSSTNYAYAISDGEQMVYYVATADINRDDVELHSSYKDAQCVDFGMDKLTNQMAAADAKYQQENSYFKSVAGVNGDFYNMITGQPLGAFVMDGVMSSNKANNRPWFAVFEDGTALCGANNSDWDAAVAAHGSAKEAVGGSQLLVVNGKDVTATATGSYNTDRHSRSMVGVTADNKVVICTLDGRQEPFSCGGTMHELAQIMLEQGCEIAINLDGGGSSTFVTRPEGEDDIKVINRPSDGSERSISSGLLIATTAAPSNVFERATLTAENDYVTPASAVSVEARGVSPAGTSAEIPSDISWKLEDSSMGTVENGVFVSSGKVGDAVVQMVYNEKVVGETVIHVVIPTALSFSSNEITVPYGKTVELSLTATCNNGLNEVVLKAEDIDFILENSAIGSINGFDFTAGDENTDVSESVVTAKIVYDDSISASSKIKLGKGSDVLFDFEDGSVSNFGLSYSGYNYYLPNSSVYAVDEKTGKVHSGNHAMALNIDYTNSLESGYQMIGMYFKGNNIYCENAKQVGMWIYIPDECCSLWARWMNVDVASVDENGNYEIGGLTGETVDGTISGKTGYVYTFEESGWHYLSIDISNSKGAVLRNGYYFMQFYISDRGGDASTGYLGLKDKDSGQYTNLNGNYTFYVDDITVDYSSAVDDREAPIFSELNYATSVMSDAAAIAKRTIPTINYSDIDFAAKVTENTAKSNATGIDASSAKAYVDGNEVDCTYSGGIISMDNTAVLSDGKHTVKFSICDNQGNYASIIRKVDVQANSGASTIKVVAHNKNADRVLLDSVNYIDIVATDIEKVQFVETKLDLDNMSKWQLDHMEVAEGFEAAWSLENYDATENIATVKINRTGNVTATGEQVLVSIPVRMWTLENGTKLNPSNSNAWTLAEFKASKETWPVSIVLNVDQGLVNFTDGSSDTFSGESVRINSEMWGTYTYITMTDEGKSYWNSWNGGHVHTPASIDDKSASCTEAGYTGRTYCDVCKSVVDWGTTIPATGHIFAVAEGVLRCSSCNILCNGEYEGKTYIDGVAVNGWLDDSYYVDGVKLTGICEADGYYYDFGDDGVCPGKVKYTGFVKKDDGWYYSAVGNLAKGWMNIDDEYYYFDPETGLAYYGKEYYIYQQSYEFDEKGKVIEGLWVENEKGTKYFYGPSCYTRTWAEIDGKTYYFDVDGYRKEGTCWFIAGSSNNPPKWYEFTEDGVLVREFDETGLFTFNGSTYYLKNGVNQYGLIETDGSYYYFRSSDYTAVTGRYWVGNTNGLDFECGYYDFDENGKMIIPGEEPEKNGIVNEGGTLYYYVNGERTYAGLFELDGNYYYANSYGIISTGRYWISKTNGIMPEGYYDFADDGKMITAEENPEKNGIINEDGTLYYYVDGVRTYAGLFELDGNYYYANTYGIISTGRYWISKTNDIIPAGFYNFAEDGKMILDVDPVKNGIISEDDGLYYYVNGERTYAGLFRLDGSYYYANTFGKISTGRYWISKTNDIMPAGFYNFDENGRMLLDKDPAKNGIYSEDGTLYYYVNGEKTYAGLFELDGNYYYANTYGVISTGKYWISKTNDIMPAGFYNFAEDGKMIIS